MQKCKCECELAGFCRRNNLYMTPIMHSICKIKPDTYTESCVDIIEPTEPIETITRISTSRKAINYISAEIKHTFYGRAEVSEDIYNDRISICRNCEFFKQDDKSCLKCGCYLETKCKWAEQECPEHKWLAETGKSSGCGGCKG